MTTLGLKNWSNKKEEKKSASSREPAENLNCPELLEESDENKRSILKNYIPDMMGEHTEFITRLFFKSSDKEGTLYQLFNHFICA